MDCPPGGFFESAADAKISSSFEKASNPADWKVTGGQGFFGSAAPAKPSSGSFNKASNPADWNLSSSSGGFFSQQGSAAGQNGASASQSVAPSSPKPAAPKPSGGFFDSASTPVASQSAAPSPSSPKPAAPKPSGECLIEVAISLEKLVCGDPCQEGCSYAEVILYRLEEKVLWSGTHVVWVLMTSPFET